MKVPRLRHCSFLSGSLCALFMLVFVLPLCRAAETSQQFRKPDLEAFFAKLERGQPVTVAAIGGSITMHRTGWALRTADKIRENFPQTQVKFVNAGISGTGSNFGLFRLGRDVTSTRPDLVFIEYVVNDGSTADETVIRNLESMVTVLRSMPEPPAIVFVQSASSFGANSSRHNLVAEHYGILAVDTQQEVNDYLEKNAKEWTTLFSDAVHPLESGHQIYADAIWREMAANQSLPARVEAVESLPARLSADELILDANLIVPNFQGDGWAYKDEAYHAGWLGRYFLGSLQNEPNAAPLSIPFYGRTVGVALLTGGGSGVVRLAVDGVLLDEVVAGRSWHYSVYVYPELLDEGWHVLSLIPVGDGDQPAKVRIAFLFGQNQEQAPAIPQAFWSTTWTQSLAEITRIAQLAWRSVPVEDWQVAGPFGSGPERAWEQPLTDLDTDYGINLALAPDAAAAYSGLGGAEVRWQAGSGSAGWVDLGKAYGINDRGVSYAYLRIEAEEAGEYDFRVAMDYFGYLYVNGQLVLSVTDVHGAPTNNIAVLLPLQKGTNDIMLKVHAGSLGLGFSMQYPLNEGLRIVKP